jgi:hypothetical protein
MLQESTIMLLESTIMLLESKIMLLEVSIMLLENIYFTSVAQDNHHMMIHMRITHMLIVQATGNAYSKTTHKLENPPI